MSTIFSSLQWYQMAWNISFTFKNMKKCKHINKCMFIMKPYIHLMFTSIKWSCLPYIYERLLEQIKENICKSVTMETLCLQPCITIHECIVTRIFSVVFLAVNQTIIFKIRKCYSHNTTAAYNSNFSLLAILRMICDFYLSSIPIY